MRRLVVRGVMGGVVWVGGGGRRCRAWGPVMGSLVAVAGGGIRGGVFFLRHGGPPPKALHQSGLTMGKMSVHGEPKFSEGQPRVFTNLVRVKTLHELHHGPEKV